jgi:hypothetical protein
MCTEMFTILDYDLVEVIRAFTMRTPSL